MAKTTVDTLLVKIQADTKQLVQELERLKSKTDKSTNKMAKSFDKVGQATSKLRKLIIGVGSVIATAFVVKKIANVSAEFQDLGLTLQTVFKGAEQGKAAIDFINEFAQRTPFDIQTLTRSFIQLGGAGIRPTEKLLTTLGDAASATVNRFQTFEALTRIVTRAVGGGLGLEELEQLVSAGIPVYKILNDELGVTRQEISELGQTAEGAEKIMNALLTGLDKEFGGGMERAANNLSVAFSNLGIAATNTTKAMGDEFNNSLTELTNQLSRLLNNLKPVAEMIGTVLDFGINMLAKAFDALNDTLDGEGNVNDNLKKLENKLGENIEAMKKSTKASEEFTKAQISLDKQIRISELALFGYNSEFAKLLVSAGKSADALVMTKDTINQIEFSEADKEVRELAHKFRRLHDIQKDIEKLEIAEKVIEENNALDENREKIEALLFMLERFPERKQEIENALKSLNPVIQILEDNFERAFDSIAQAIADSMTEGKNAMESFRRIALNIINSLIRDFIRLQMEQAKSAFFPKSGGGSSMVSSLIGGIGGMFGGGGGGSIAPHVPNFGGAANFGGGQAGSTASFMMGGSMSGRAGGGSISRGMPTVVGERGAELFVPNTSGRIVNNANIKGMGGSTTVINQNINVETGVAQTVRAEMLNLLPQFKAETIGAVAESRLRGGEFASAFSGGK